MSRMAEHAHDQQERDNESGMDLCEAWHHEQRRFIDEIHEIVETQIKNSASAGTAQRDSCISTSTGAST